MADYTIAAGNVTLVSGGLPSVGTAGENMTAGMPFYKDTSDSNKGKKCDANSAGKDAFDGIVLTNTVSANQPFAYASAGQTINLGTTLNPGDLVMISANAGLLCPSNDTIAGHNVTIAGFAASASNLTIIGYRTGVTKT